MSQTPAGWYPDNQGTMRWWDGTAWTAHTRPAGPHDSPAPQAPAGQDETTRLGAPPAPAQQPPAQQPPAQQPPAQQPPAQQSPAHQPPAWQPPTASPWSSPSGPVGSQPSPWEKQQPAQQPGQPAWGQPGGQPGQPGGQPGQPGGQPQWGAAYPGSPAGGRKNLPLLLGIGGGALVLIIAAIVVAIVLSGGSDDKSTAADASSSPSVATDSSPSDDPTSADSASPLDPTPTGPSEPSEPSATGTPPPKSGHTQQPTGRDVRNAPKNASTDDFCHAFSAIDGVDPKNQQQYIDYLWQRVRVGTPSGMPAKSRTGWEQTISYDLGYNKKASSAYYDYLFDTC